MTLDIGDDARMLHKEQTIDQVARYLDEVLLTLEPDHELSELDYDSMGEQYQNVLKTVVLSVVSYLVRNPEAARELGIE